jgi:hypothetical protein
MNVFDAFKLAKIKHPDQVDNEMLTEHSCPLKEDQIEVLYPSLDWSEILWGNTSILVKKEKRIEGIKSFKFYKKDK